jgi:LacI family transcriptional regulator
MVRPQHIILAIESSRAYGRGCLLGIAGYARTHRNWHLMHLERGLDEDLSPLVSQCGGDGVIARIDNDRVATAIDELAIPTVDLRGVFEPSYGVTLDTDHEQCAKLAADHLLFRGFRNLAFCGYEQLQFSDRRESYFRQYLSNYAMDVSVFRADSIAGGSDDTLAHEARGEVEEPRIAEWLKSLSKPLGVFACNDVRGRQVLAACGIAGLKVPDEVAVVGVDNDEVLCELANPPMSSIEPDTHRLGRRGAELLHCMLAGEAVASEQPPVPPRRLVIRGSSDVMAVDDPELAHALRYIRDHASEGINVAMVVDEVAVSRSVLERRFQQLLNRTPKDEIERVQIEHVQHMLLETDWPLERIATMAGYATAAHMCTVFRRRVGETPGQYRQRAN